MHLDLYQVAWKYNVPNHRRLVSIKSSSNCHIRSRFFGLDPRNAENNHANTKKRIFFRVLSYGCNNCVSWCEGMNPSTDIAEVVPAPEKVGGVALQTEAANEKAESKSQREPIKFFALRVPEGVENVIYKVQDSWHALRLKLVPLLPAVFVNSSAKIIGVLQVTGEMLMLKSTGAIFVPDKSNFINYIIQPPKVVYDTIFKKAQSSVSLRESIKPKNLIENIKAFTNLGQASKFDSLNHTVPLINRWQARSALGGIVAGIASSALPDVKESPEQVEANAIMLRNNPIRYVAQCFGQALWFPAETVIRTVKKIANPQSDQRIGEHKRQFAGLGLLGAGLASIVSGFRQVGGDFAKGEQQIYRKNKWHIIGGMITSVAGNFLMTGINNQQGWGNFGSTQMARMTILYPSIHSRFTPGANGKLENNRWWYAGGQSVFQGKNIYASLVGGAEVKKDGTIDYHVEEKKDAMNSANQEKIHRKEEKRVKQGEKYHNKNKNFDMMDSVNSTPNTTISNASVERAMPERVAMVAESKEAATV